MMMLHMRHGSISRRYSDLHTPTEKYVNENIVLKTERVSLCRTSGNDCSTAITNTTQYQRNSYSKVNTNMCIHIVECKNHNTHLVREMSDDVMWHVS